MRQQVPPQTEEHIRLILGSIDRAGNSRGSITGCRHPGIMAGRHEVGTDLFAISPKLAELEPDVADDAWIGRSSRQILVREVFFDPREVALEIKGIKRDVEA